MTDSPPNPEDSVHSEQIRVHIDRLRQGRPRRRDRIVALGSYLPHQFARDHERAYRALGRIAEQWEHLVPPALAENTALESFRRGVLTVHVPDAAFGWDLERLLAEGLEHQLRLAVKGSAIRRVKVIVNPDSFTNLA